ncbi:class I SAM-dependent methyltransferase [uncultured Sphingomonas sp.]|uniref:class I SAM-dependent methyltransferase n=1 Tax=uncultured Sphingomonas sp. TaxID=158754 RepID=UPI0035CBA4F5
MTTGAEWAAAVGDVWAAEWVRTDRSFAGLSPRLDAAVLAAAPAGLGRAVDLGCGAGQTSIALAAARPDLTVLGVDISPELVRIAAERGRDLPNLRFAVADVAADPHAPAGADLLFSRHGVMFYDHPAETFAALRAAAAPGARLVFSCFRSAALNPWAGALAATMIGGPYASPPGYAPGPFAFADPDRTAAMLAGAGWTAAAPEPVDYRYVAGSGPAAVADAATFFRRVGPVSAAIKAVPADEQLLLIARLTAALTEHRDGEQVSFAAAAWIWSAHA